MSDTVPVFRTELYETTSGYGDYMGYETHEEEVCEYRDVVCDVTEEVIGKDDEGAEITRPVVLLRVYGETKTTEAFSDPESFARRIDELLANGGEPYAEGVMVR
jgi:hypothetical protein